MTITTTIKEFPISNMWNDAELMNTLYRNSSRRVNTPRHFEVLDRQLQKTGVIISARTPGDAAKKAVASSKRLYITLQDTVSSKQYKYKRKTINDRFVADKR